jgi:hypothetical protein
MTSPKRGKHWAMHKQGTPSRPIMKDLARVYGALESGDYPFNGRWGLQLLCNLIEQLLGFLTGQLFILEKVGSFAVIEKDLKVQSLSDVSVLVHDLD